MAACWILKREHSWCAQCGSVGTTPPRECRERGRGQGGSGPHLEKHEAPHVSLAPTLGSASNSQQDLGRVFLPLLGLGFPLCAIRIVRPSLPSLASRVIGRHVRVHTHRIHVRIHVRMYRAWAVGNSCSDVQLDYPDGSFEPSGDTSGVSSEGPVSEAPAACCANSIPDCTKQQG